MNLALITRKMLCNLDVYNQLSERESLTDFRSRKKQLHVTWRFERKPPSWKSSLISGKTLLKYLLVLSKTFTLYFINVLYTFCVPTSATSTGRTTRLELLTCHKVHSLRDSKLSNPISFGALN